MESNVIKFDENLSLDQLQTSNMKVFNDKNKLNKIAERMVEIERAFATTGRKNTQFTSKNMSLFMLGRTPYSILHQCLAQIEQKKTALKENLYKHKKNEIKLKQKQEKLKTLEGYEKELLELEINYIISNVKDSTKYIEGSLKELAQFQEIYLQVKEANNIPDKWDELDYENAEVEHHIKQAFTQAVRDMLSTGRPDQGNLEYFDNCGIHPLAGIGECEQYIFQNTETIKACGKFPDMPHMDMWLDEMFEKYKYKSKERLQRMGITAIDKWYIYQESEK